MSRAYRVAVSASLTKTIAAADRLRATIELLPILSAARMGQLLRQELREQGYREQGEVLVGAHNNLQLQVWPEQRRIEISVARQLELSRERETEATVWDDERALVAAVEVTRAHLEAGLEAEFAAEQERLREALTVEIESELPALRSALDALTHRVLAAALKEKAAALGEVSELLEDRETGSLTIRVRL